MFANEVWVTELNDYIKLLNAFLAGKTINIELKIVEWFSKPVRSNLFGQKTETTLKFYAL